MKTVLIISDSHASTIKQLPERVVNKLKSVDMVLHAGDHTEESLYEELSRACDLYAVCGNTDSQALKSRLPRSLVVEVEDIKIGLTHPIEGGIPFSIEKKVCSMFKDVDIVVYGHTHRAKVTRRADTLLINPGSVTGVFPAFSKTCALLCVDGRVANFRLVKV